MHVALLMCQQDLQAWLQLPCKCPPPVTTSPPTTKQYTPLYTRCHGKNDGECEVLCSVACYTGCPLLQLFCVDWLRSRAGGVVVFWLASRGVKQVQWVAAAAAAAVGC